METAPETPTEQKRPHGAADASRSFPDVDVSRLNTYLTEQRVPVGAVMALKKFDGGQSNPTYLLSTTRGKYVLRRKPFGNLLKGAHAIEREYFLFQKLGETRVPVPRMVHLCEDSSVIGADFYIMEFVPGRIFWNPALAELPAEERGSIFESLVATLATLHSVNPVDVGLEGFGRGDGFLKRQVALWERQYRAAETERIEEMEQLLSWVKAREPVVCASAVTLVHGDYRLDNLIFSEFTEKVAAILDWELATLGDPMTDLAYLCMCLRLPQLGGLVGLAGKDRAALGLPDEEEVLNLYARHRGIARPSDWDFYLAFSFFRFASICQGVYRRSLEGNASNASAAAGNFTRTVAAMAAELISAGA